MSDMTRMTGPSRQVASLQHAGDFPPVLPVSECRSGLEGVNNHLT